MNLPFFALLALLTALTPSFAGVMIKGASGAEIEFAALFDAKPTGLVALIKPDGSAVTIPWDKIDLVALKERQSEVYKAYEKALATQKDQPLGMGLAESMLSLSQLQSALKQAVKDPYYWPYGAYSYQTIATDSSGKTTTRTYTTTTRYPTGYVSTNAPFIILKRIRDAQDDNAKRNAFSSFKMSGYGFYGMNTMIERIDYVLEKIPPAKMFPRQGRENALIMETARFKKTVTTMATADALTLDHQNAIKSYFALIGIE